MNEKAARTDEQQADAGEADEKRADRREQRPAISPNSSPTRPRTRGGLNASRPPNRLARATLRDHHEHVARNARRREERLSACPHERDAEEHQLDGNGSTRRPREPHERAAHASPTGPTASSLPVTRRSRAPARRTLRPSKGAVRASSPAASRGHVARATRESFTIRSRRLDSSDVARREGDAMPTSAPQL